MPTEEPAHHVVYFVSTVGTANDDLRIGYTSASGASAEDSTPGFVQFVEQGDHHRSRLPGVSLNASGASSDLAFMVTCSITIDGLERKNRGPYACYLSVDFATLPAHPTRSAGPSPAPATVPTSVPPYVEPAACRYVTESEATLIVAEKAGGTPKPVLAANGDATRCTYVFDYKSGRITFSWTPGGKADPIRPAGGRRRVLQDRPAPPEVAATTGVEVTSPLRSGRSRRRR